VDQLKTADDPVVNKAPFKKLLASGEYLDSMPREDMVKVLVQGISKVFLAGNMLWTPLPANRCLPSEQAGRIRPVLPRRRARPVNPDRHEARPERCPHII
jgi:hypothetical protein